MSLGHPYETGRPGFPDEFVAYDIETSGFRGNGNGRIVEFGAIRVDADRHGVETMHERIALPPGCHMNPHASSTNGIYDWQLVGCPPMHEVFPRFVDFVGDLPVVGYNNHSFDDPFVLDTAERLGNPFSFPGGSYDALTLFSKLHPSASGKGSKDLARACEVYGVTNQRAHDSLADAIASAECWLSMEREAREHGIAVSPYLFVGEDETESLFDLSGLDL